MAPNRPKGAAFDGGRSRSVSRRRLLAALGGSGIVGAGTVSGGSQPTDASPSALSGTSERTFDDPAALEEFVDDLVAERIGDETPGAVVAVVDGEETVVSKGYGTVAADSDVPVRADETLFRLGSVSKVVTFTAVMQGVERGTLDLDEDVNAYLADSAVEIPDTYQEPVTLRHLGTHTAGFGWVPNPGVVDHRDELTSLETALLENRPERRRPPGEAVAYSNYGAMLAGHVVAEAHETTFEEYARSEIFEPLGMDHSTFVQPVPDTHPGELASPHTPDGDRFAVADPVYINWRPAGSMSATATDVAAFVSAHLEDGTVGDTRLLEPETVRTMHERQYERHPAINGWAYGLWEDGRPEDDALAHTGATIYFLSDLVLSVEHDVGIFVGYNARGGETEAEAVRRVIAELVDEYDLGFDASTADPPTDPDAGERAERVADEYGPTWQPESELGKVIVRLSQATIESAGDGELVFDVAGEDQQRFVETEPYVYHEVDGYDALAFEVEDGGVVRGYRSSDAEFSWEPVPVHERQRVAGGATGIALGGFLLSTIGWGGLGAWRWWRGRHDDEDRATNIASQSDAEASESETEGSE
ncbi:serine hydrolase [Natronococcus pandeyae]|uniref:Serine hydrolase n=1 Tax=Natronococcus pandeyae TaxID=2055836 RepID=A0A8J8Q3P1_9EURY|nr:serine hydrolase domain-containing protein [Natronococcus pandeyae]TYL36525.1 serine hydrolase [Natronococcus pandeyae]